MRDALRDAARESPDGALPPPIAPPGEAQEVVASSAALGNIAELQLESLSAALGAPPLRAAVYVRTPDSFISGRLRLTRLAAWPRSGESAAPPHGAARGGALPFLPLPPPAPPVLDAASLPDPESLNAAPSVLVLPAAGALVLPLRNDGVLLGLLVAERAVPSAPWAPPGAPWAGGRAEVAGDGAAFSADARAALAAVARALALAWALDQAASAARMASNQRARQMSAYLAQARSPLAAIRTLGALLTRQLAPNEPPRDLAAVIIEQSERLGELTASLQAALFPSTLLPAPPGSAQASFAAPPGTAAEHAPGAADGQHWAEGFRRDDADDEAEAEELWSRPDGAGPAHGAGAQAPPSSEQCDVGSVLRPLLGALDGVAQATGVAVFASLPGLGGARDDDDDYDDGPVPLLAAVSAADARRALSAALEATLHATPPGGSLQVRLRSRGAMLCVDVRCSADQLALGPAATALRADTGLRLAAELLRSRGGSCDPLPGGEPGVVLRFPLASAGLLLVDAHVEADALDAQIADE